MATACFDFGGGPLKVACLLDATACARVARCSRVARAVVEREWRYSDELLQSFDVQQLNGSLAQLALLCAQSARLILLHRHDGSCICHVAQVSW